MAYYKLQHHNLDPYPNPKDRNPLYINEPQLIDRSKIDCGYDEIGTPEQSEDNVRIFVPLDINADAILRRLDYYVYRYKEANEKNEMNFWQDVDGLVSQIEIYDQVWSVRDGSVGEGRHSKEAIELVRRFVHKLEEIPGGGAELFPFELIRDLKDEFPGIKDVE